jgi:hypothetical protein
MQLIMHGQVVFVENGFLLCAQLLCRNQSLSRLPGSALQACGFARKLLLHQLQGSISTNQPLWVAKHK